MKNYDALSENPDLQGDAEKGKKVTTAICVTEIIGEILMVVNFLVFTSGISYHKHIPFALELTLLIVLAIGISVLDIVTISANRITRVVGTALITSTFFYNVMDFFLGLALLGAENWQENVPTFLCCTLVCVIKLFCVRGIFKNRHVRTYFYKVNKARYGL